MVRFGLNSYQVELGDWAKHYKEVSVHFKREYKGDKETVEVEDEKLIDAIKKNPDKIMKKAVSILSRQNFESTQATDYYLSLVNLDYQEGDLDFYSIGSNNTSHEIKLRLVFKIEYVDFIVDYSYKTEGSFATSFYSLLNGFDSIEDLLDEVAENEEKEFRDKGIKKGEEDDYYIVGIDEYKHPTEFEISKKELLESLVAVEVYEHNMTIN